MSAVRETRPRRTVNREGCRLTSSLLSHCRAVINQNQVSQQRDVDGGDTGPVPVPDDSAAMRDDDDETPVCVAPPLAQLVPRSGAHGMLLPLSAPVRGMGPALGLSPSAHGVPGLA